MSCHPLLLFNLIILVSPETLLYLRIPKMIFRRQYTYINIFFSQSLRVYSLCQNRTFLMYLIFTNINFCNKMLPTKVCKIETKIYSQKTYLIYNLTFSTNMQFKLLMLLLNTNKVTTRVSRCHDIMILRPRKIFLTLRKIRRFACTN